jgi:hypothetical protein
VLDLDSDSDSAPWETELEKISTDTSVDSAPRSARPPRRRMHPRTASRTVVLVARRVWPVPTRMQGEAE